MVDRRDRYARGLEARGFRHVGVTDRRWAYRHPISKSTFWLDAAGAIRKGVLWERSAGLSDGSKRRLLLPLDPNDCECCDAFSRGYCSCEIASNE